MAEREAKAPSGCYKCGQQGHWSRDCPTGRSTRVDVQEEMQTERNDAVENQEKPVEPKPVRRNARSKLTVEMLKEPDGIPLVYSTFPDLFKVQYKGKGHEVGDLGRFLTMYRRWQKKFMGITSYEDFLLKLERVGATYQMKKELRGLRYEAWKLIEEESRPGGWRMANEEEDAPNVGQDGSKAPEGPAGDEVDDFGWDEDEISKRRDEESKVVPPEDVLEDMDQYVFGNVQEDPGMSDHHVQERENTTGSDSKRAVHDPARENKASVEEEKSGVHPTHEVDKRAALDREDSLDVDQEISSAPEVSDAGDSMDANGGTVDPNQDALEDDVDELGDQLDPRPPVKRTRVLLDEDE
uniref:CCHC-type domain-containing protein n=1 Tax=Picocystis salinarum TaxID=88271 RepID=A0A6U9QG73_9CHLO